MISPSSLDYKICYSTFATANKDPNAKFLRCSGCKMAYYTSKEAATDNWKNHKKSCGVPDFGRAKKMTMTQAMDEFQRQFKDHVFNCQLVPVLVQIYNLLKHEEDPTESYPKPSCFHCSGCPDNCKRLEFDASDVGLVLHTMSRFNAAQSIIDNILLDLWAVPGMPQFLLSTNLVAIVHEKQMKKYRDGFLYPETVKYTLGAEEFNKNVRILQDSASLALSSDCNSGCEFAYFLFNILVRTATRNVMMKDVGAHDGEGDLREGSLGIITRERAMELYLNQHVRDSCEDALAPGSGFVLSVMKGDPDSVPQLLNRGLIPAVLDDLVKHYCKASGENILKCLRGESLYDPSFFFNMTPDAISDTVYRCANNLIDEDVLSPDGNELYFIEAILKPDDSWDLPLLEMVCKRERWAIQCPWPFSGLQLKPRMFFQYLKYEATNGNNNEKLYDLIRRWNDMSEYDPNKTRYAAELFTEDGYKMFLRDAKTSAKKATKKAEKLKKRELRKKGKR